MFDGDRSMTGFWRTKMHVIQWSCLAALCAIFVLLGVPWQPVVLTTDNLARFAADLSGILGGLDLLTRKYRWGIDVLFPHGPLFFVRFDVYFPGTMGILLVARCIIALGLATGTWLVLSRQTDIATRPLALIATTTLFIVVMAWISSTHLDVNHTIIFLIFAFCFGLPRGSITGESAALIVLSAAAAAVALQKFPFFIIFAAQIVTFGCVDLWRRRLPILSLAGIAWLAIWWFYSGQEVSNFLPYVSSSFLLASGFNEAMGIGYGQPMRVIHVVVLLVSIAALLAMLWLSRRRFAGTLEWGVATFGVLMLFFMHYKHGVVRHDGHIGQAATAFACFLIYVFFVLPLSELRAALLAKLAGGAIALVAVLSVIAASAHVPSFIPDLSALPNGARVAQHVRQQSIEFGRYIVYGEEQLVTNHTSARRKVADLAKLPDLQGGWDAFPDFAGVLVMAGKNYAPRPSYIGLNTYAEASQRANADFIRSAEGPSNILFRVFSLDYKLPSSEDALVWRELLEKFSPHSDAPDFLVFRRVERARKISGETIENGTHGFGVPIRVRADSGEFVWAELDIRLSWLGKLVTTLYKPPEVFLTAKTGLGKTHEFKIAAPSVRAGFLLSPLIEHNEDMVALFANPLERRQLTRGVVEMSLSIRPDLGVFYERAVGVRLQRMKFDPDLHEGGGTNRNVASANAESFRRLRMRWLLAHAPAASSTGIPIEVRTEPGVPVLFAHAESSIKVPVPESAAQIKIGFGMLPGAYSSSGLGDGVMFIVTAISTDGGQRNIWQRHLKPSDVPSDRGDQSATITLPKGKISHLVLTTNSVSNLSYDVSYWSDAKFE